MKVLVTGGAGYLGSHAVRHLLDEGYEVTVLDDLSTGCNEAVDARAHFVEGSAGDRELVSGVLASDRVEAVMHFAAHGNVAESVRDPEKYYRNNLCNTLELLHSMRQTGVRRIIFSSSAAVYGNTNRAPIEENLAANPLTSYGRAMLMTEWALGDYCDAYGLGYAVLRVFNAAGAASDGSIGEDHSPETHLIPLALASALSGAPLRIFGTDYPTPDGTCIRDYVHVMDLVRAHRLALERLEPGRGQLFHVGNGRGFSVREVISACAKVCGRSISVREEGRRPGDPAVLVASSRKIRDALGWEPEFPALETILRHAWEWHLRHSKGHGAGQAVSREARSA